MPARDRPMLASSRLTFDNDGSAAPAGVTPGPCSYPPCLRFSGPHVHVPALILLDEAGGDVELVALRGAGFGGEQVNTIPTKAHHRYVISFRERSEEECHWPDEVLARLVELNAERAAEEEQSGLRR